MDKTTNRMFRMICLALSLLLLAPDNVWAEPPTNGKKAQSQQKRTAKPAKGAKGRKGGVKAATPTFENPPFMGYLLMDLQSGQILEAQRDTQSYIPASVAKVPSTLAALHILGANHRFVTSLLSSAPVVDGELQGDLILVGGGDPSLTMPGLVDLAHQLQTLGIHRIRGRFLFDESAMIPETSISTEQNDEESYNQGLSALSLDPNRVRLRWMLGRNGQLLTQTNPNLGDIALTLGPTSKTGPTLTYLGGTKVEQWRLNPHGAKSGWDWVPVKRPGRHTAMAFREYCRQNGLLLSEPEPGHPPSNATILASRASAPLQELADSALAHSNNFWTEMIGIMAASRLTGQPQSATSAAKVLSDWIMAQLPQVEWNGFHLTNSCGLSSSSRMTPRQMVAILLLANAAPIGERSYASMLPVSGWKGTLAGRFAGPDTSFRVWAKTGTILYGKALAGYLFTKQNRRLVFAIFASDMEKRKAFDANKGQHSGNDIHRGRAWNTHATGQINALVERWLKHY
ncbi:MAG: D-alanyl-D-alanine carboxypeptidase/D-alanyl-D-alanine-endopeptidase [Magnetococcales bacterium]|nr:D-alanyl-D-alanine carboxypeptidase/D-alanyl-D-alanine-endopeptidase [Magnetococcales bacterium]